MPMAKESLHGGADRACAQAGRDRDTGRRGMPGDGDDRVDLLSPEEAVWRAGSGRDSPAQLLEEENRRLKQLVADLSLDKLMLQDVVQKKL